MNFAAIGRGPSTVDASQPGWSGLPRAGQARGRIGRCPQVGGAAEPIVQMVTKVATAR